MPQEVRKPLVNCGLSNVVVVVQEQKNIIVEFGELVDQRRNPRFNRKQGYLRDHIDHGRAEAAASSLQSVCRVVQKTARHIVVFVEAEPGDLAIHSTQTFGPREGNRSFAEAGCRLDHRELLGAHQRQKRKQSRTIQ